MVKDRDGAGDTIVRLLINLAGLGLTAGVVALVVATIVHEAG
ncbi:MAG: hypothetical protein Q7T33_11665 [Dehalococcoidia bacterium]|nr:hypothetical protein [Dehalococcoidia bacterium]